MDPFQPSSSKEAANKRLIPALQHLYFQQQSSSDRSDNNMQLVLPSTAPAATNAGSTAAGLGVGPHREAYLRVAMAANANANPTSSSPSSLLHQNFRPPYSFFRPQANAPSTSDYLAAAAAAAAAEEERAKQLASLRLALATAEEKNARLGRALLAASTSNANALELFPRASSSASTASSIQRPPLAMNQTLGVPEQAAAKKSLLEEFVARGQYLALRSDLGTSLRNTLSQPMESLFLSQESCQQNHASLLTTFHQQRTLAEQVSALHHEGSTALCQSPSQLQQAHLSLKRFDSKSFQDPTRRRKGASLTEGFKPLKKRAKVEGEACPTDEAQASDDEAKKAPVIVSERSMLTINEDCKTPEQIAHTLKVLGTTLRCKADPYIDVAHLNDPGMPRASRGGICELFPHKLYRMIQELCEQGNDDIVSFLPHGRAFAVHKMDQFENEILPKYFAEQKKWGSFSRQLHLYGFCKIGWGADRGAFYHELFLRGRPNLLNYMRRVGVPKGPDRRRYKMPSGDDPDFHALPPLGPMQQETAPTEEAPSTTSGFKA